MRGYISLERTDEEDLFRFGFSVPAPDGNGVLLFNVFTVLAWGQQDTPEPRTLIGQVDGLDQWVTAAPGVTYRRVGMYLGDMQVLMVHSDEVEE